MGRELGAMLSAARGCQGLLVLWATAIIGSPFLEKTNPNKPRKTWELQQLHARFLPSATGCHPLAGSLPAPSWLPVSV